MSRVFSLGARAVVSVVALALAGSVGCGAPAVFDPASVTDVFRFTGPAQGIAARPWDGTVFIASGRNLAVIANASSPTPVVRAALANFFPGERRLAVEDRTLYSCGPGGIEAYDIRPLDEAARAAATGGPAMGNVALPSLRQFTTTNACKDVVAFRGSLVMAMGEFGFGVMDWTDPGATANPVGHLGGGDAVAVVRVGRYAYGADATRGLAVLDFGPTGNAVVSSMNLPSVIANPTAIGALNERTIFVADARQFLVLDLTMPAAPRVVGRSTMGAMGAMAGGVGHIVVREAGRQAFVATGGMNPVQSFDLSNASAPRTNGTVRVMGEVPQLALVDDVTLGLAFSTGGAVFRRAR